MEAVSCTVEASPRREAYVRHGPKAPTLAPNSPNGSGSGELFSRRYGEETQEPFLSGFELGEYKTNRRRSAWSSGHWQRGGR